MTEIGHGDGSNGDGLSRTTTEAAPREGLQTYHSLFDKLGEGLCIIEKVATGFGEPVDFRYLDGNPSFLKYTATESVGGKSLRDLFPHEGPEPFEQYERVLLTGEPARFEHKMARDGRILDVRVFALDGRPGQLAVILQDITERRQANQALSEREAELARVQRIGEVGGVDIHINDDLRSRRSPEYLRLHGLPPGLKEETHAQWRARVFSDDREHAEQTLFAALNGDSLSYDSKYRIVRPSDGETRWIHARADIERDAEGRALRLVGAHLDVTEQMRTQDALRESEERKAFLLKLSDALRPLADPEAIKAMASHVLGEHMGVSRALYAEIVDEKWADVRLDYVSGARSLQSRLRVEEFGRVLIDCYRRGETVMFADATEDMRFSPDERTALVSIGARANLSVPLIKDGRWVAAFGVHSFEARNWTHTEAELVRETAERTWAAVERARAEAALVEREERYRTLFESIDDGFCIVEMLFDAAGEPVDYRFIEANGAFERHSGIVDAVGKTVLELVPNLEKWWISKYGSVALTGSSVRFEHNSEPMGRWFSVHASRVGGPSSQKVAIVFNDITERKTTQTALQASEARQAFLLRLSDALMPLDRAVEVELIATEMLGEELGVNRVFYAAIEPDGDTGVIRNDFVNDVSSAAGRYSIAAFGPALVADWRAGRVTLANDVSSDPHYSDAQRAAYQSVSARATIAVPLVKRGSLVAMLAVNHATPRKWTEAEIELVSETAIRIWDALQRAIAEEALRESEARLRTLVHGLPGGAVFIVDRDFRYQLAGGEALGAAGFSSEDLVGRTIFEALPPNLAAAYEKDYRHVLEGGQFEVEHDAHGRSYVSRGAPLLAGNGSVSAVMVVSYDMTERKAVEQAMRDSEERLREFGEASSNVLWIRDAETLHYEYLTKAFEKIYGIPREAALQSDTIEAWTDLIVPEDRADALANIGKVKMGEWAEFEFRIRRPSDGQIRWIRNTDFPMRDADGRVAHIGGVGHDVTALKEAEAHQKLLLAELQHRVRNTLAVIRAIVRRTAEQSETLEENSAHLEGRIAAFARVQGAVTRDPTSGVDLASIVAEEIRAAGEREGEAVTIDGASIRLTAKAAETLGLAVHELTTNALKYGALSQRAGRVLIAWRAEHDILRFEWTESGMSNLGQPQRTGFGREILEKTLTYEFRAVTNWSVRPSGVHFEATIPLERITWRLPN